MSLTVVLSLLGNTPVLHAQSPIVSTGGASVGFESALFFGTVVAGDSPAFAWFEYGVDQSVSQSTKVQEIGVGFSAEQFSAAVEHLDPYRTYYYRVVAYSRDGVVHGAILRVTTGSQTTPSPVAGAVTPLVLTKLPSAVGEHSIRFNGLALPGERTSTLGWFEWGTSYALGDLTPEKNLGSAVSSNFSHTLSGLSPDTQYYYRAVIQNKNGMRKGDIVAVTTKASLKPVVSNPTASFSETSAGTYVLPKVESVPDPVLRGVSIQKNIVRICSTSCREATNNTAAEGGAVVEYQILVKNTGGAVLRQVMVEDDLSPFVEFANASHAGVLLRAQKKVSWTLDALDPGEAASLSISARVRKFSETMTAVTAATAEVDGARVVSHSVTLRVLPPQASALLSLIPGNEYPQPGSTQTYTVFFRNNTNEKFQNIRLSVAVPQGLTYVPENSNGISSVGNVLMYRVDTLPQDEERKFSFQTVLSKNFISGDTIPLTVVARFDADHVGPLDAVAYTITEVRLADDEESASTQTQSAGVASVFGVTGSFPGVAVPWLLFAIGTLGVVLMALYFLEYLARRRAVEEKVEVAAPPGFHF